MSALEKNLELVYENVDNINDAQLKVIEDSTQEWFNKFYAAEENLITSRQTTAANISGAFNFLTKDYNERRLTVLFEVMLEYEGQVEDSFEILQKPWTQPSSVGSYRQVLVDALPVFFENVEATTPPEYRQIDPSPAPTSDEGLSQGLIVGIIVIIIAVVVIVGIAVKFQMRARNQTDNSLLKSSTTPYSPHVNEEEDSVLFPDTNANASGPRPGATGGLSMPSDKDDQSYEGRR